MRCRGRKVREQIVKDYKVVPVAHIKLLLGQIKRSDAEADIRDEYYIFEAIDSNGKKETIQCGMGAARDFLALLNHNGLPLFNPLHMDRNSGEHGRVNSRSRGNKNQEQNWNPTALQLYNAIMWLIIVWDAKPSTPLFDFKKDILENQSREPFIWKVRRVNTVIQRGGHGRTLTEIINSLRSKNNIRNDVCQFNLLIDVINNIVDDDGSHIQSFF